MTVGGTSTVNPSYEVHQVRWSRKALGQLGEHVQRAWRWLEDNAGWHPSFVHAAPMQDTEEIGGGSTPEAKAYAWPEPKESQAQRKNLEPLRRGGGAGASAAPLRLPR